MDLQKMQKTAIKSGQRVTEETNELFVCISKKRVFYYRMGHNNLRQILVIAEPNEEKDPYVELSFEDGWTERLDLNGNHQIDSAKTGFFSSEDAAKYLKKHFDYKVKVLDETMAQARRDLIKCGLPYNLLF